jgi:hypothetical protein
MVRIIGRAGAVLVVAAVAVLGGVGAASATSQATVSYGTFTCSDSRTFEVFGMAVPRFPAQVGFVDGRGIVARWFAGTETGRVTILATGEVIHFAINFEGPLNRSQRVAPLDFANLTSCTSAGSRPLFGYTLTQWDVDYLGLDRLGLHPPYAGALANIVDYDSTTVWVNPVQFAHR